MPNFKSDLLTLRDLDANGNGLEYILFPALSIQIPLWHNKKAIRKTSKCILVNFIQSKRKWNSLCRWCLMLFSFERKSLHPPYRDQSSFKSIINFWLLITFLPPYCNTQKCKNLQIYNLQFIFVLLDISNIMISQK